MAQADALAQQGQPAAAAERLAGLFRGRGASDAVHDRYRELLIAARGRDVLDLRELVPGSDLAHGARAGASRILGGRGGIHPFKGDVIHRN